jgi:hypothetical protein
VLVGKSGKALVYLGHGCESLAQLEGFRDDPSMAWVSHTSLRTEDLAESFT